MYRFEEAWIRYRTYIPATILVLILYALGVYVPNEEEASAVPDDVQNEKIVQFANSGWEFKLGRSIDEIKQNLGRPLSEEIQKVANMYTNGQVDEIHVLDYDGLSVGVYRVNEATPREILTRLAITSNKYRIKWGLNIGVAQSEVKRVLGKPQEPANGTFVYEAEYEVVDSDSVSFYFRNGVLQKIQWEWHLD